MRASNRRLANGSAASTQQYLAWRRWVDIALLLMHFWRSHLPNAIVVVRFSVCAKQQCDRPLLLMSPGAAADPWLLDFPCVHPIWLQCSAPWNHGEQHNGGKQWLASRWHWVVPYVNLRYSPLNTAPCCILALAVLLLPLAAPVWWVNGGRTLAMSTWRLSLGTLQTLALMLSKDTRSRIHLWDVCDTPWPLLTALVVKRGMLGAVPWRWHWRVTLLEAAALLLSWVARHNWQPPPSQLALGLCAASVGVALSLALYAMEMAVVQQLHVLLHSAPSRQEVRHWCAAARLGMRAWVEDNAQWLRSVFAVVLLVLYHLAEAMGLGLWLQTTVDNWVNRFSSWAVAAWQARGDAAESHGCVGGGAANATAAGLCVVNNGGPVGPGAGG